MYFHLFYVHQISTQSQSNDKLKKTLQVLVKKDNNLFIYLAFYVWRKDLLNFLLEPETQLDECFCAKLMRVVKKITNWFILVQKTKYPEQNEYIFGKKNSLGDLKSLYALCWFSISNLYFRSYFLQRNCEHLPLVVVNCLPVSFYNGPMRLARFRVVIILSAQFELNTGRIFLLLNTVWFSFSSDSMNWKNEIK